MALSTTDLGNGSSGLPKTIAPGNHRLKINSIQLDEYSFIPGAYHLVLNVETEPIADFEGFMIDKDDATKGHYKGQIGRIKMSQYAFADGETRTGIKIQRDRSIMIALKNLSMSLGIYEWFVEQNNKFETIEDFVKNFDRKAPMKDKFIDYCVAGKEYMGKSGYVNYDMYLPKSDKNKFAYGDASTGKVITYDEKIHLKKMEVTEVKSFGESDDLTFSGKSSNSDFSLD